LKLKTEGITTILALGDSHNPYHHQGACDLATVLIEAVKPQLLIHMGDGADQFSVAHFVRDPAAMVKGLQAEFDSFKEILRSFADAAGKQCEKVYLRGNHDRRISAFIATKAKELYTLDALQLETLLGLKKIGFELTDDLVIGKTTFVHGFSALKHAGTSPIDLISNSVAYSGVQGHSHRLSCVWKSLPPPRGKVFGAETGHLSDVTKVEWLKGKPADWQMGLVVFQVDPNTGIAYPEPIPFYGQRKVYARWRGVEYRV